MFLSAVTLVLQEILEAALLIALLLVLAHSLGRLCGVALATRWVWHALGFGILGALVYGWYMPQVSEWFDYAGYEVVNSLLQGGMIACLAVCVWLPPSTPGAARWLPVCMSTIVTFSILREGSEIILYGQGILGQPGNTTPALLGALMAAGIGVSSGYLLYVGLGMLKEHWSFRVALLLLALYCGNMAAQAVLLLTQAGWLPETETLWDSSAWLPESGIAGQLLGTLVGYDANPSAMQAGVYLLAFFAFAAGSLFRRAWLAAPESTQL